MVDRGAARRAALDLALISLTLAFGVGLFLLRQRQIAGAAGLSSFPLDDSWIHLHFARNLAEGHGFAYNPGVPVAGSTAPLWTLLLAGVFALLGSEPFWAKCLGIAATLAAALATRRLAWIWTQSSGLALAAGTLTALSGPLVWGALSGMEVSLAAVLVTAALICHATGHEGRAAALLGLGVLARPEAALLMPLCWLARPITARRTLVWFGVVGVIVAPWVLFNVYTTGTPLPSTASAKVEGGLVGLLLSGTREPVLTAFLIRPWSFEKDWIRWLGSANVLLPPLIVLGLWTLWRRGGFRPHLPAAVLVLHPIGMALLAPYGGPSFQEGRYSIHLFPLACAVAVAALAPLASSPHAPLFAEWRREAMSRRFARLAVAGGMLIASLAGLVPAASRYGWAVQNIDAMQVRLGRWVLSHTPPEARLALNDVGAIAFVARREVVDVMGLVSPAVIPYRRAGEAGVLRYLERTCPDYLIIFPAWFPRLSAMSDRFAPIYRIRLDHNTVAGADEMVVYETPWNRWRNPGGRCRDGWPGALREEPGKSYNSS